MGRALITREEIIAFAAEFDPQPMHLDEEAAERQSARRACGVGLAQLLSPDAHDQRLACCTDSSFMGAPGVEEVKWLAPVRPGERSDGARDRAGDPGLAQPGRHGLREVPLRAVRLSPSGADDADGQSDVRTPRRGRRRNRRAEPVMKFFEDIEVGETQRRRAAHVHRRGRSSRSRRASIRSPSISTRRPPRARTSRGSARRAGTPSASG